MWQIYERKVVVLTWGGLIFWKYLELDMKILIQAGVLVNGVFEKTETGTPQGR